MGGHTRKSGTTEIIFKMKKMQKNFYFKKLRVVLAELRILQFGQSAMHFGNVGRLLIAHANSAVRAPDFAAMQVCTVL